MLMEVCRKVSNANLATWRPWRQRTQTGIGWVFGPNPVFSSFLLCLKRICQSNDSKAWGRLVVQALDQLFEVGVKVLPVSHHHAGIHAHTQQIRQMGVQDVRVVVTGDGFVKSFEFSERISFVEERLCIVGLEHEGHVIVRDR